MTNIQRNFQKAFTLYEIKGPFLPPKISWKLDLILYMIQGNLPNKQFLSLQQLLEYEDLQNLDKHSLKIVFNNIIDTLFSKQIIQSRKCQIKKKGIFTTWVTGNIHHDKNNFLFTFSHKNYTFQKANCQIKKSKESKRSIDLQFQGSHKYTIKFENQQQMKSIWHSWQKEIIETKTQINYQQMKTLMSNQKQQSFMDRISLFCLEPPKTSFSPERCSFSPQTISCNSFKKQVSFSNQFSQVFPHKKILDKKNIHLKPVPHGFICKLKSDNSLIAINRDEQAKIYIEHVFSGKLQQKRLLSFLLLQKSWNSFIVMQLIQKSQISNQVQIYRKYDTFRDVGQFIELNLKATYSSWNSNMSMITIQSMSKSNNQQVVYSNSVITLESDNNKVRILIQEQLTSNKHESQKLKKILLQMYRQIIKLQLIHEKIVFKDFQAQTIITNMLQDQQSTNTQSQEDIAFLESKIQSSQQEKMKQCQEKLHQTPKKQNSTKLEAILCLKSPLQFPNPDYIKKIRAKQYQKNYFKYKFSQQILNQYEDYTPFYQLEKLVQNKVYEITASRDLKFIDQQLLDSQKQILRFILRQIGANLISGKSILNVSLPVEIFQPRSGLQRGVASYASCPDYLLPRAYSSTLEQMKYVSSFIINVVSCELVMQKPFNPILGQTFQGYIKGIPVYYEQISHNPPVTSYYMTCPQFKLYGNLLPFVDVGLNTGVGGNLGIMNIIFANGSHFQCYIAPSEISGLIYGDRKFRCYNKGFIWQKQSRIYAEYSIQNQKKGVYQCSNKLKGGQIIGGIYLVKQEFIDEINNYRNQHKNLKKFGGLTKEMIQQKYHSIIGEWFGKVIIDSEVMNQNFKLYPVQFAKNVLPSDSNHRLDVLYHKMKDLTNSQKQKQNLQNLQRNDKKLRQKYSTR